MLKKKQYLGKLTFLPPQKNRSESHFFPHHF